MYKVLDPSAHSCGLAGTGCSRILFHIGHSDRADHYYLYAGILCAFLDIGWCEAALYSEDMEWLGHHEVQHADLSMGD